MSTITEHVGVDVPVARAYSQWTRFESFPKLMEGADEVRQMNDTKTHWVTKIVGIERQFDSTITEQLPDERVARRSEDGPGAGASAG